MAELEPKPDDTNLASTAANDDTVESTANALPAPVGKTCEGDEEVVNNLTQTTPSEAQVRHPTNEHEEKLRADPSTPPRTDRSYEQNSGNFPTGWSWLASGATDLLSTLKDEVSTVAVGVSKVMQDTVKEVREDIQEIGEDIRSMLTDEPEIRKDSNKCLVAVKRLNLIDKRVNQLNVLVDDFQAFRSILATKHRNLRTFLEKKKIGGQVIVDACLELSKSIDKIDSRQAEEDRILDANFFSPLGVVVERIQICRDVFAQYQDKKKEFQQTTRRCRKSIQNDPSPENATSNQEALAMANQALETAEIDFIDSVKSLQKFIETHIAEKFHSAAENLNPAEKSLTNESEDETDVELMNALEAESSVEGSEETPVAETGLP